MSLPGFPTSGVNIIALLLALSAFTFLSCDKRHIPVQGMIINSNISLKKGNYIFHSPTRGDEPLISITGENLILDFEGVYLSGDSLGLYPETFTGTAISIINAQNVILKNLNIRGFKVAIYAENARNLTIENCNLSYNYRPKLLSIREREDFADWLSYHQNDEDEWLRFGAGIYLKNCPQSKILGNTIMQNQNGLLMVRTDSSEIYNNVFAFNSGLGLGLYRSSHNRILHNCLDFNVRGHSEGFYRRGQDSAGALFYEQSSYNYFCYNSAKHSGDGFFLWAGNETIDSGEGGCNHNIIAYNDFSYAPTNGIEVTFSSNIIIGNTMKECRYGVWGGYSFFTIIAKNHFENNEFGIAIENGHDNAIVYNNFSGDKIGIKLWERTTQPSDWAFSRIRDVQSRNYRLGHNTFVNINMPFDIQNTQPFDTVHHVPLNYSIPDPLPEGLNAIEYHHWKGTDKIRMNEYGPYNYRYPHIWLTRIDGVQYTFWVGGESGLWKLLNVEGFHDSDTLSGNVGDTITLIRQPGKDYLFLELQYMGDPFTDQFGMVRESGYLFHFDRYEKELIWTSSFYGFSPETNPIHDKDLFKKLITGKPLYQSKSAELYFAWWGSPFPNVPADYFASIHTTESVFEKGQYEISITGDDGFRLFVDGRLVIEEWQMQEPLNSTVKIELGGKHQFEIHHFDLTGFSTIDFKIRKTHE